MVDIVDHRELAKSRLATQFRESTNLINYIQGLLLESNNLEQVFQDLLNVRYIDTAEGAQLDILGIIVGQPRVLIDADIFSYFGFLGNPSSKSFGTLIDSAVGGAFRDTKTPIIGNRTLTDEEYRLFIRARIVKNLSRSTPEDIISQLKFLFNTDQILFVDGDLQYTISIGKKLTANDKAILFDTDLVSKTVGVRINYLVDYDQDRFFSFAGIPNSDGFGSLSSSQIGGYLGSLI
tara:strand:+ start:480 stop:1184 length:705 start_codon:yes stop_codon:yes gene_type:complete